MKRVGAVLTAALILLLAVLPASGEEKILPSFLRVLGTIEKVEDKVVFVYDPVSKETVELEVADETYIINAADGTPAALSERTSDSVSAYYLPAAIEGKESHNALALMINREEDQPMSHYIQVQSVTRRQDGQVTVLCDDGGSLITFPADAVVLPFKTKNIVTLENINPGSELVVWYDIMLLSYPGQAGSNRVIILSPGQIPERRVTVSAQGEVLAEQRVVGQARTEADGTVLVPLRAVGEALGFTVTWNGEENPIVLTREGANVSLTLGKPELVVEGQSRPLDSAPRLLEDTTYVPLSFWDFVKAN